MYSCNAEARAIQQDLQARIVSGEGLAIFDLDGLRCAAYNALGACGYQVFRNASGPVS
jgi:hypothetical protein